MFRLSGFVDQVEAQSDQLHLIATCDDLTGLANRRLFNERLAEAIGTASTHVLLLDLNGFKKVNDRYGHGVGDRLLVEVARRLPQRLRSGDLAGRMGGDEFAVMLYGLTPTEADAIAERIAEALSRPIDVDGTQLQVGASIGAVDCGGEDPTEILRRADVAMYTAKAAGDNCRRYTLDLDEDMNAQLATNNLLENRSGPVPADALP
jgi:diguanylate cyclase (GGDEF)-like protein